MSTPKRKTKNELERDGPSRSNKSGGRAMAGMLSMGNATANRLSVSTRATLLGVRDVKDPFSAASDNAVKEFRDYIVNASPDEINLEECSLLLHATARLLSMQMKLQTDRITELAAFVTNTAKEPSENNGDNPDEVVKKKRGRKKNENNPEENSDVAGGNKEGTANPDGTTNPDGSSNPEASSREEAICSEENSSLTNTDSVAGINNTSESSPVQTATDGSVVAPEVTMEQEITHLDDFQNDTLEDNQSSLPGESLVLVNESEPSAVTLSEDTGDMKDATCTDAGASLTSSNDNQESNEPLNISQSTTNSEEAVNSSENLTVQNTNDPENSQGEPRPVNTASTIIPCTRSANKRQAKENPEGTPAKKRRPNGVLLPPILSPNEYLDYGEFTEEEDSESEMECEAPLLYPEVDLWNGQFDLSADPDAPFVDHAESDLLAEGLETLEIANSVTQSKENETGTAVLGEGSSIGDVDGNQNSIEITQSAIEATAVVAEGSPSVDTPAVAGVSPDVKNSDGPSGDQAVQNTNEVSVSSDINAAPVNCPTGAANMELNSEDQQEIQNCINQLHYLPFTCELTKVELERTFDTTVDQLERIFKKYNTVFNRQLLNAATVVCANMVSSFSSRPSSEEQGPYKETEQLSLSHCREIFSQGINGVQAHTTSLINSEKTILERTREKSFAESQATIQKRLEEMQRVIVPKYIQWPLIAENTPEFFHRVKQFEQKMKKVLADEEKKESFDVSKYEIEVLKATESNEEEVMEVEESDDTNTSSSTLPSFDDALSNGIRPHGMMSPVFNSQSSHENGRKWVPLSTVFNHMKKFDRNECARHFYAVLALLSSQNLDMNYDRHYSQESAASVTKKLDHTQDGKYPRGFKIMTSRCPDADKEEIYVTALASKSCNESFRDLISNEMHRHELPDNNDLDRVGKRNDRTVSNVSSMSNGEVHTDSDDEFVPVSYTANFSTNLFGGRKKRKN